MARPPDHPRRIELNDEVHARPPEALATPTRLSYLALLSDAVQREQSWALVRDLALAHDVVPPAPGANHYSENLGAFRLKWERHSEFTRYTFVVSGAGGEPFAEPAIRAAPAEWVAALPGNIMHAAHAALVPTGDIAPDFDEITTRLFSGNVVVGAVIGEVAAIALTDFRIHEDGFSRLWVQNRNMTPRQSGRMIQRLLEIDTYRMMALLALPVARELTPFLTKCEQDLSDITAALVNASEPDEPLLLGRLTRLGAEIDSRYSATDYRFSAAKAYYELVQRRIADLREERIRSLQTFSEFTERRLAPAMHTLRAADARQESLSQRMARATQLLSTRVDITRQRQNQELLESMNRRAKLSLRLQQTVEGLSVAAVTYYVVGLIGYAAKGVKAVGVDFNPDLALAASIPVVAIFTAIGLHGIRRSVNRPSDGE